MKYTMMVGLMLQKFDIEVSEKSDFNLEINVNYLVRNASVRLRLR
jgi:hypothetical protein